MKMHYGWVVPALMVATTLMVSGCGGGDAPPPKTFPLRAALDALTRTGSSFTMQAIGTGAAATKAVDGDCSGSLVETDGAANTLTIFESTNAYSSAVSANLTFTAGCALANITASETDYFDSASLVPLGAIVNGFNYYGVYDTPPVIPVSVQLGSSGDIGTLTFYTDSTKATPVGTAKRSYVIEADGPDSVIANSISNAYDAQIPPKLTSVSQVRYRLGTTGKLTMVSQDIVQYDNSKTPVAQTRLVFRCTLGC